MTAFKDWLNGLTSKTTPVDADELYVRDSSGTPGSKKLTWANLKATLANTFLSLTGGTVAGGTRTTSGSTLTITETLNNAGVTFPGALVVDVTDTASAAGSLLADFKVGGVSRFSVKKDGSIGFTGGAYDHVSIIGYGYDYGGVLLGVDGGVQVSIQKLGVFANGVPIGAQWGGYLVIDADNAGTDTVRLYRDANHTLAQRNGTNAQTFRLYNTYTDASNYERGFMRWNSNVLEIGTEAAGTGTIREISLTGNAKGIRISPATNTIFMVPTGGEGPTFELNGIGFSGWAQLGSYSIFGTTQAGTANRAGATIKVYPLGGSGNGTAGQIELYASLAAAEGTTGHTFEKALSTVLPAAGFPGVLFAGFSEFAEQTAPAAPAANGVRIYAEDNGAGKTRLMALFATGAAVQIAIEP